MNEGALVLLDVTVEESPDGVLRYKYADRMWWPNDLRSDVQYLMDMGYIKFTHTTREKRGGGRPSWRRGAIWRMNHYKVTAAGYAMHESRR